MIMVRNIFLFLLFSAITFYSCKKDAEVGTHTDFGYNYFPNDVGRYVIYEVDSIYQDDNSNKHDTIRYLLKEVIAATFSDNSNRPTLRLERYYRRYNSQTHSYDSTWIGPRVWTANRTQTTLEKKEENITYLKLVFPAAKDKQWNGNLYNMLGDKEYKITSIDHFDTVGAMHFDSVAVVMQFTRIDIIEYRYEYEKYARNVGLIYKTRDSLYFSSQNGSPPYIDTIGYRYTQKIISYGK